jgi:hypothetical protein
VSAKLGFFELALLYMALGLGAFFAAPLMPKVGGPKVCMAIGSVFDCIWVLGSLLPVLKATWNLSADETPFLLTDGFIYVAGSVTSVLSGSGEALQWVAEGKYIADCASVKTKGFFFGYFWAIYMGS